MFLASCGCDVTLAVRGSDVTAGMSSYLIDRLRADPRVTVRPSTEVTELHGGERLQRITQSGRRCWRGSERRPLRTRCYCDEPLIAAERAANVTDQDGEECPAAEQTDVGSLLRASTTSATAARHSAKPSPTDRSA
ncbi:hypothetical protein [Actinacidiphila rubida]|uniref:hypothetical protein n=1 Tax=Actinacidiphila rubida TaxID=310780 RepID=UPI00389942D3